MGFKRGEEDFKKDVVDFKETEVDSMIEVEGEEGAEVEAAEAAEAVEEVDKAVTELIEKSPCQYQPALCQSK